VEHESLARFVLEHSFELADCVTAPSDLTDNSTYMSRLITVSLQEAKHRLSFERTWALLIEITQAILSILHEV
jgi:starvation-inducible outer membrane lipoprotein